MALPQREGEDFLAWWERRWYASDLPESAYGHTCVIARMRRGKYVRIPLDWRGQVPRQQTIRKRDSKKTRKARNRDMRKAGKSGYFDVRERQEALAPKMEEWDA